MPRRAAVPTQADIARAARALKAEGFEIIRLIIRGGEVSIEVADANRETDNDPEPEEREPWVM